MKKITLLLITLFATGTMLMAQGGPRRGERDQRNRNAVNIKERAERMSDQMAKEYALNDAQKRQVYEANLIMMADMQPTRGQKQCPYCGKQEFNKKRDFVNRGDSAKMGKRDRTDMKAKQEEKMAEMKKTREAYDAKIKNVLTKEQYAAYSKKQAERQKQMEERRAARLQDTKKS